MSVPSCIPRGHSGDAPAVISAQLIFSVFITLSCKANVWDRFIRRAILRAVKFYGPVVKKN